MNGQFPISEKFPSPRRGAGFHIRAVAAIFMFVVAFAAPVFGQSQTAWDPANDPIYLREMTRFMPELAAELKTELQSAKTPEARQEVLQKYDNRIIQEARNFRNVPEALRPPSFMEHLSEIRHLVGQAQRSYGQSYYQLFGYQYKERQAFEDSVIKDVGFKDFNELYDYFRELHPDDLGREFMEEAKGFLDKGLMEKYAERMELLQNVLKSFRLESAPSGESILPELTPHNPADPPNPAEPPKAPQSGGPGEPKSACEQICEGQPDASARNWCKARCSNELVETNRSSP